MSKRIEMEGRRFGRLVVQDVAGIRENGERTWRCACDCGGVAPAALGSNLRRGISQSCGCLTREKSAARMPAVHAALAAKRAGVAA